MAAIDHLLLNLQLSNVNFNGLIMQLKTHFWKLIGIFLLLLSKTNVQQSYFKDLSTIKEVPLLASLTRNISSNFLPWVLVSM